jgi:UDP-4-amino-4,6-dideoxy-N-acetyl-beta-L-altrosamine N-acetyltransferase
MIELAGRTVSVREMTANDAPLIVAWRNDPETARRLVQWEPLTVEAHLRWFERARAQETLLVFVDRGQAPVGAGAFYAFDHPRRMAEWGRLCFAPGASVLFALEASYLAHRIAFDVLALVRLHCGCAVDNTPAVKLNETLGYKREGLRRRHLATPTGVLDVVEFGMFPDEFNRREIERLMYHGSPPPQPAQARSSP